MSKLFNLNGFDFIKGCAVAVFVAILTYIQQSLTDGGIISWKQLITISITSLIAYLIKQLMTDSDGAILSMIGSRRRRKKKPTSVSSGVFTFDELDFSLTSTFYAFSDVINDKSVNVYMYNNLGNTQTVEFAEPIDYNDFETLYFEIED